MASDLLNSLDSLDEVELQGSCEEQTEKVQQLLEACDVIAQAKIVSAYLPKIILCITECQSEPVLKALLPAAEKVCNTLYKDLQNWKDADQIPILLQACTEVLDGISTSCGFAEHQEWRQPGLLASLALPAFRVVKSAYAHCQDSSQLYGSALESVNGPLTKLFRAATALQSSLHRLADRTAADGTQLFLLASVCDAISETGRQLTRLDPRAMAEAWKSYLRLLQRFPERLPAAVALDDVATFMAGEVAQQMDIVTRQGESSSTPGANKQLARALKMASFYLKMVVGLSESYIASVNRALGSLIRLVFLLIGHSAPDGRVADLDPAALSQLSSQLTVAAEPLLDCLLEHQDFPQEFWSSLWSSGDLGGLCRLRCCLSLARRACHLPEPARTAWTTDADGERHLVAAVLRLMPLCDRELSCCAPVDSEGHGQPQVSLYQHTLTTVCALIGSLTSEELQAAEPHLWRSLVGADGWAALLASDTLCFVARYGPAGLCRAYCQSAAAVLSGRRCAPLFRLLCRLAPLLAESDRAELPSLPAAARLLGAACPSELLGSALDTAERLADRPEGVTGEEMTELWDSLSACSTAVSASPDLSRLRAVLDRLWTAVPARLTGPAGSRLASGLLRATAALPTDSQISDERLAQVLSLCSGWLPGCSVPVKLGIIRLLDSIKSRHFPSPVTTSRPAGLMPAVYRHLLTDRSLLVRQRALDTFASFATCTPHTALISASVSAPPGLQSTVSRHLQRLAGRPRGHRALAEAMGRARVSSEAAAALTGVLGVGVTVNGESGDVRDGRSECEDLAAAGVVSGARSPLSHGALSDVAAPSDVSPLPPREARLLEAIQSRLAELGRGRGRSGTDDGHLLRLLTDIQARLEAG